MHLEANEEVHHHLHNPRPYIEKDLPWEDTTLEEMKEVQTKTLDAEIVFDRDKLLVAWEVKEEAEGSDRHHVKVSETHLIIYIGKHTIWEVLGAKELIWSCLRGKTRHVVFVWLVNQTSIIQDTFLHTKLFN